jgi:hypothetical protein
MRLSMWQNPDHCWTHGIQSAIQIKFDTEPVLDLRPTVHAFEFSLFC